MKNNKLIIVIFTLLSFSCKDFFVLNISDKEVNILAPLDGATISTGGEVQFWWDPLKDATQYRVQVVTPSFDSTTRLLADTLTSDTKFSISLPAGKYEWRISGVNSGYMSKFVTRSFQMDTGLTLTGKIVSIVSPINGSVINNKNINFSWDALNGALLYRIQIDSNLFQKHEFTTSNTFISLSLNEGNWSWRVRAENNTTISQYSNNSSFSIDITAPSAPIPVSPLNNANINQGDNLIWQSDTGVAYDSIFVYSDVSLSERIVAQRSINKSHTLIPLSSGIYFWQVFSYDNAGNKSTGSNIFRFVLP